MKLQLRLSGTTMPVRLRNDVIGPDIPFVCRVAAFAESFQIWWFDTSGRSNMLFAYLQAPTPVILSQAQHHSSNVIQNKLLDSNFTMRQYFLGM